MATRAEHLNYILKVDKTQKKKALDELSDTELAILKVRIQTRVDKKNRRGRPRK
jgi:hypothetical protein